MNPLATNYNPLATVDDGSCIFVIGPGGGGHGGGERPDGPGGPGEYEI